MWRRIAPWAFAISCCLILACQESLVYLAAASSLQISGVGMDVNSPREFRRKVQGHFRKFGIYLPMERIFLANEHNKDDRYPLLMQRACGHRSVYAWLPLKLQLPLLGVWYYEVCWPLAKEAIR